MITQRKRIAVVGAGISGLSAAWLLAQRHAVTLYEAAPRLGGHSNTVDVTLDGVTHPVDTGFLVFNHKTYPNLTALFAHLGVDSVESEMSFAVRLESPRLEWAGSSLATVFAQKRNLVSAEFWLMLKDIMRFNRETTALARAGRPVPGTLGEFLDRGRYGRAFTDWYLLPMGGAIWSCPTKAMLDFPAETFLRFCFNHGLLAVNGRPKWRSVNGGAREYVRRLAADIADVRTGAPVERVLRGEFGVELQLRGGRSERYDRVVLACHGDQALRLLGDADAEERALLGAFRFQRNRALLHTDASFLPRARDAWSAWNYHAGPRGAAGSPVSVSYLINRLQPLPFSQPVLVTLNPYREPAPGTVVGDYDYEHPVFDSAAVAAQGRLASIQGRRRAWFCGAWTGYGFHEDGLRSGMAVANRMGVRAPWQETQAAA
jgi:predicted NAD/FAD-binding protein